MAHSGEEIEESHCSSPPDVGEREGLDQEIPNKVGNKSLGRGKVVLSSECLTPPEYSMIGLQDEEKETECYVQEVKFRDTVGMSLVLDAKVKEYKVNAVNAVDSAAQVTVISNELANRLELYFEAADKVNLKTVSGMKLPSLKLKGFQ